MSKRKQLAKALVAAVSNGQIEQAESLLAACVDINQKIDGMTLLHFVVASRSSMPGFRWLLAKGVDLDIIDDNGLTPLMTVCGRTGKKANEMALALINAGCDVTIRRDDDQMSALEFAAKSAEPIVLRALVKAGALVNGMKNADLFPALVAVRAGNLANLKTLVALGCNLTRKTQLPWAKGMTCLEVARLEGQVAVVKYLESIDDPKRRNRETRPWP
jgi:ankyrin repeat protein